MTFPRALLLLAAPALLLAACATPDSPGSGGSAGDGPGEPAVVAAPGEVIGQGLVLQKDGEDARFCLGAVAESYPPQCSGPVVVGWQWPDDGMSESAGGVTFGSYAITGTWDGVRLTPTQDPIPLALYDPMMQDPDPHADPANAGDSSEALLTRVQDELSAWTRVEVLMSWTENGYVWATVYYDDGSIQAHLDEVYGADVVVVQSALRDLPAA